MDETPGQVIDRADARPSQLDLVLPSDLADVIREIGLKLNYQPGELDSARKALTLLKAPARRAAMAVLARAELPPEGELTRSLGYHREDLYHHLRVLCTAGVLKRGPAFKYRTAPEMMAAIRRYLDLLIVVSSRSCSGVEF